jgi:hypothetical protein
MYPDVPKKKQACEVLSSGRYVKVYDRVTDGLESHRAFRFFGYLDYNRYSALTFAYDLTGTTSSTL